MLAGRFVMFSQDALQKDGERCAGFALGCEDGLLHQ